MKQLYIDQNKSHVWALQFFVRGIFAGVEIYNTKADAKTRKKDLGKDQTGKIKTVIEKISLEKNPVLGSVLFSYLLVT